jgi:hypothetical protein
MKASPDPTFEEAYYREIEAVTVTSYRREDFGLSRSGCAA